MSHTSILDKTDQIETIGIAGIMAINSLGGPPLPIGETDIGRLKTTLANQAAMDIPRWLLNVALMAFQRR